MKDVNLGIVTCVGAATGDDGPQIQVRLTGKKKVAFDIATEKYTFFEAKHAIGRNMGKSPVVEVPSAFDPYVEVAIATAWYLATVF